MSNVHISCKIIFFFEYNQILSTEFHEKVAKRRIYLIFSCYFILSMSQVVQIDDMWALLIYVFPNDSSIAVSLWRYAVI